MKFIDLKDKEMDELKKMLAEKKSELFEMKLKLKTMQLTKTSAIVAVRKDIARLNTAISAKTIDA